MRRFDYFLAGLGGALMVALFYVLSPAVLQAVQYPPVVPTDYVGYVGSANKPMAVSVVSGPVPLGGVVTGLSSANVFNSTNTVGNTMNNALIVNNPLGYGPLTPNVYGDVFVMFDPYWEQTTQFMYDRPYYNVAQLPISCSGVPTILPAVVDATDAACTNGAAPVGGGTASCTVTCVGGVYKMNGTAPDGPPQLSAVPSGNGFSIVLGPWGTANLGSSAGGLLTCYSHQAATPDTCVLNNALLFKGATSGTALLKPAAIAGGSVTFLPTVNTTMPTSEPGTSGMALTATTAGVQSYAAMESYFDADGTLGASTSTAADTLLVSCTTATRAGHFVDLTCTDDFATACTTAPQFKPRNNTQSTVGTVTTCPTTAGQSKTAQTLVFAAGDQICLVRSVNGSGCTAPSFSVQAHISYP